MQHDGEWEQKMSTIEYNATSANDTERNYEKQLGANYERHLPNNGHRKTTITLTHT